MAETDDDQPPKPDKPPPTCSSEEDLAEIRRQVQLTLSDYEAQLKLTIASEIERREADRELAVTRRLQGAAAILGVTGFALFSGFGLWLSNEARDAARIAAADEVRELNALSTIAASHEEIRTAAVNEIIAASQAAGTARGVADRASDQARRYQEAAQDAENEAAKIVQRLRELENDVQQMEELRLALEVADRASETIASALDENPELLQEIADSAFPDGIVAAFVGREDCPSRWVAYEPAAGRFLVGAGDHENVDVAGETLPQYQLESDGGRLRVGLTIQNLPEHTHNFVDQTAIKVSGRGLGGDGTRGDVSETQRNATTSPSGQKSPEKFPIIPPYIAVQFCLKS